MKFTFLTLLFTYLVTITMAQNKETAVSWEVGDQWELEAEYHSTDCCVTFIKGSHSYKRS